MVRLPHTLREQGRRVLEFSRRGANATGRCLVRYRVRLSVLVFTGLVAKSMLLGYRPHDVADLLDPISVAGIGLILSGLALRSWAAGVLHKVTELTVTGPYRLIRHPLYLGSLCMVLGVCLTICDYVNLVLAPAFIVLVYAPQIWSEEHLLSQIHHESWAGYAVATGRFFPRQMPHDLSADWRFGQWLRNREYNAVGAMLLGLIALKVWAELP